MIEFTRNELGYKISHQVAWILKVIFLHLIINPLKIKIIIMSPETLSKSSAKELYLKMRILYMMYYKIYLQKKIVPVYQVKNRNPLILT